MPRKPPKEWVLTFPAAPVTIDGRKHYIRMKFYGRMKVYVLKGRGWRHQELPDAVEIPDSLSNGG